jgi:OCT family organic cation transporter-like MFS transporter 4/5
MECVGGNDKWRAVLGLSTLLFWAAGFISTAGIVYLLPNWRHSFLAMASPTLLFVFYAWLIPESPLWLIHKGRIEEAEVILAEVALKNGDVPSTTLPGMARKEAEIKKINQNNNEDDDGVIGAFWSLVATPNLRRRTFILSLAFFVASFLYYGLSLNSGSVGGDNNLFLTFTLYGVMEIPALLFAIVSLLTLGRRLPCVLLYLFAGLACLTAAVVTDNTIRICLAVFGKFCITACFHTLFVYTSEMYATPNRNTGLSVCSVFARVAGMTAPFVAELKSIHPFLPIAVFGGCGVVASLMASFLPETKGTEMPQTLTESEQFGNGDTLWSQCCNTCSSNKRTANHN